MTHPAWTALALIATGTALIALANRLSKKEN